MPDSPSVNTLTARWASPVNVQALTLLRPASGDFAELKALLPLERSVQRLLQVHGARAVDAARPGCDVEADACFSRDSKFACAVVTADCLPLLVCNRQGTEVAAIHAGWRGMAAGIIESTVQQLQSPAEDLQVWMGPAIGQNAFEVGPEVCAEFVAAMPADETAVRACFAPGAGDRLHADLYALARLRLRRLGIDAVTGGGLCTVSDASRFHSWRRDGPAAGRMISLISIL